MLLYIKSLCNKGYVMSANDVRKNFVFKKEVAQHLKEIAQKEGKSMTSVVQDLIETKYQEVSKEEKLKAFYEFAGSNNGVFGDLRMQDIKVMMGEEMMRRCEEE